MEKQIYTLMFTLIRGENKDIIMEKILADDVKDAENIVRDCYSDFNDNEIIFNSYNPLQIEKIEDILKKNKIIVR